MLICAGPVERTLRSVAGVAPATVVTVERDPHGDEGRYAALLRRAGVAVDELRYAAPDPASAERIREGQPLLADLGEALRRSVRAGADESAPGPSSVVNERR